MTDALLTLAILVPSALVVAWLTAAVEALPRRVRIRVRR